MQQIRFYIKKWKREGLDGMKTQVDDRCTGELVKVPYECAVFQSPTKQ
jgi:hypothetical protein